MVGIAIWGKNITEQKRTEDALRRSELKFRTVAETARCALYIHDGTRFLFTNRYMSELLGYAGDELLLMPIQMVVHPDDWSALQQSAQDRLAHRTVATRFEARIIPRVGDIKWVEISTNLIDDYEGAPAIVGIALDITARKEAEMALRTSERHYRMLFESAHDAIFVMQDERFIECNPAAVTLFGCAREVILGQTPWDFSPEYQPNGLLSHAYARMTLETAFTLGSQRIEWTHQRTDGSTFEAEVSVTPLDRDQRLLLTMVHDISAYKRAQEAIRALNAELEERIVELAEYQTQLQRLSVELVQTEERERRHIAQTLHDSLGQVLAFLYIKLDWLSGKITDSATRATLDEVTQLAKDAVQQARALTFELSPPALYDSGIEQLAESFTQRFGQSIVITRAAEPLPLTREQTVLLYVCIREVLMNSVKHAHAHATNVRLARDAEMIVATIDDDGVGFDSAQVSPNHYGLFSIQERLKAMDGIMRLDTAPGCGTRVHLQLPMVREEETVVS